MSTRVDTRSSGALRHLKCRKPRDRRLPKDKDAPALAITSRWHTPVNDNQLLLESEIFPDYGRIEVSDAEGRDSPDSEGRTSGVASTEHTVAVFTMSADQAMADGHGVSARILCGTKVADLGTQVFDAVVEFTSPPRLGLYGLLDDEGVDVPIERTGPVRIHIFVNPPQEAEEVNVLIRYDP